MFNIEGYDKSPEPITCNNQPKNPCPPSSQTGCLDTNKRVWSCGVNYDKCKGSTQKWCENYPGKSPTPTPVPHIINSNDTAEFKKYLKFEEDDEKDEGDVYTEMVINWDEIKSDNPTLFSLIACPISQGKGVTFTDSPGTHTQVERLSIRGVDINFLEQVPASFVVELLKFIKSDNLMKLMIKDIWPTVDIGILAPIIGQNFQKLESLYLNDSRCGDIGVLGNMSQNFPSLKSLVLRGSDIYGDISVLGNMSHPFQKLESLDLSYNNIIGDISVLGNMSQKFPSLKSLDLSDTNLNGYIGVLGEMSQKFPSLKELNLNDTNLNGDIGVLSNMSQNFPSLKELDLSYTNLNGDISVLDEMSQNLPKLEVLYLSDTNLNGDISVLSKMSQNLQQFPFLNLSSNTNIQGDINNVLGVIGKRSQPSVMYGLDLSYTNIQGNINDLDEDTKFPKLQSLNLSNANVTSNVDETTLNKMFPDLIWANKHSLVSLQKNPPENYCLAPSFTPSPTPTPQQ